MAFYPFYKKLRDSSQNMQKGNFGLWYNKFIPLSGAFKPSDENGKDTMPVEHYFKRYEKMKNNAADMLKRKHEELDNYCINFPPGKYEEVVICATLSSPLITGIGESHPHEVSMVFDHNMGIPYIPASGVKGITRFVHTVMQIPEAIEKDAIEKGYFNDEAGWTYVPDLFGTQKSRGKVVFLDAYPETVPCLHTDIMNPHYGPYYSDGAPPADHHNPTPIKFLTVAKGTTFIFRAVAEKKENLPEKVRAALTKALTEEGVGAKTAVGYGRFVIDEKGHALLLEKRAQRQQAEENRRFPWRNYVTRIDQVDDWGEFKQRILDNEKLAAYRNVREVAETVRIKALEIRQKWQKSWEEKRDHQIAAWLEPAGITWRESQPERDTDKEGRSSDYEKIEKLSDWGAYKSASIDPSKLAIDALHLLKKKMESWGCQEKNAKEDKKLGYKRVKDVLRQSRG
ncbi:MAG: type III-B CRISPR module RAMP protein Cmr6 [Syntrophales bacterium]|nr:type III-B CRISPR module RAMP protein Cmr6 [Syntrophales bacterium]